MELTLKTDKQTYKVIFTTDNVPMHIALENAVLSLKTLLEEADEVR